MKRPIGIFDSGVGGLTVFKAIRAAFPEEDLLYFGDTAIWAKVSQHHYRILDPKRALSPSKRHQDTYCSL